MNIGNSTQAVQFQIVLTLRTNLLLLSGQPNEVVDNTIDTTPDGKLHINGYVWASLFRRALQRIKGGDRLAARIGKYDAENGVSPLWTEATMTDLPGMDHRAGNAISRKWKSTKPGALFSEEIVPPGIRLTVRFNFFPAPTEDPENIVRLFQHALWVINEGVENIGGGWTYGFGRLKFESGTCRILDLTQKTDRKQLFAFDTNMPGQEMKLPETIPDIIQPWKKLVIHAKVADGQLLAIHTAYPLIDPVIGDGKLPDSFVFRRYAVNPKTRDGRVDSEVFPQIVITGKAFRQAIFSTEIERRLKTAGEYICYEREEGKAQADNCDCLRCRWFGSTSRSGIVAVLDAPVEGPETEIIKRVQLCEHSMQNIQLFSGEYLKKGSFDLEVIIDQARDPSADSVEKYLEPLLDEISLPDSSAPSKNPKAPPGWYRIGATSSCTGQIAVSGYTSISYQGGAPHEQ